MEGGFFYLLRVWQGGIAEDGVGLALGFSSVDFMGRNVTFFFFLVCLSFVI